ncbi:MAG TPA: tetratricopeptide repeat protein [Chthoniobacterales bacterium]
MISLMTLRMRILVGILFLFATAIQSQRAALPPDPDKDPQMLNLLQEARTLIDGKKLPAAIEKCDKVIASFKTHYGSRKEKIYCARTSAETLGYLLKAATDKHNAIALSSTWSDAHFMKAYALQDLGRLAEAKSAVQLAVSLSPWNSRYLSELGNLYQLEKNWPKAREAFETAEDQAPLSPDDVKAEELGRARRGLAYVFVEQGKLAEAEKKYQQCLAADPHDTRAAQELEYVRGLRAKTKSR